MSKKPMNEIIKERRIELGYTLEFVGNKLGVAKSTVLRWENGETSKIKLFQLKALCEILHIDQKFLFQVDGANQPEEADTVLKRERVVAKLNRVSNISDLEKIEALIEVFLK